MYGLFLGVFYDKRKIKGQGKQRSKSSLHIAVAEVGRHHDMTRSSTQFFEN